LILLDIYPARETPIEGITSNWLLNKVNLDKKKTVSKELLIEKVLESKATVMVMIGAGDIGELVNTVRDNLLNRVV